MNVIRVPIAAFDFDAAAVAGVDYKEGVKMSPTRKAGSSAPAKPTDCISAGWYNAIDGFGGATGGFDADPAAH